MVPNEPGPPADPTSAPWIRNVVSGSGGERDWQALFERYRQVLTVYATRQLGPALVRRHSPEDLVQAAWSDVYRHIGRFEYRGKGSLRAWLRIKIRREAARLGKSARPEESQQFVHAASGADVAAEVEMRDYHERILASLDRLPVTYRRVLEARFVDGHRVVAIARALGLKPDTVSQQIRRGVQLWRQDLGEDPSAYLSAPG